MLLSFLLGLLAGYAEPYAEPHVKKAVEDVFDLSIPVEKSEFDMLALLLLLAAAALIAHAATQPKRDFLITDCTLFMSPTRVICLFRSMTF